MVKCRDITHILLDVTRSVSSSLELTKVTDLVLKESIKALRADHASLFLAESMPVQQETGATRRKHSTRLALTKAMGFSRNQMDNIKLLGAWEVINTQVLLKRSSLVVNDVARDQIFKNKRLPFSEEKMPVHSFLAVPLKKDRDVVGTLIVSNEKRTNRPFAEDDKELLILLSYQMAIALSNAQLFEELARSQAEAAQNEKMAVIGTLSAGINHEIANPLAIARQQCEIFLLNEKEGLYKDKTRDELFAKAKDIMLSVMGQTERAAGITRRLSNFAKPSKGETEPVGVSSEIDEVLGLLSHELRMERIEVDKRIDAALPQISVDRKQFQEVLFNLIRNAAQAIGEAGKITISANLVRGVVTIDITDTGSGMTAETRQQVFKPFFTTKAPGKGTGLGLFIVRKIVEKNLGKIYIKNTRPGKGTTFTLEFPICIATDNKP